MKIGHPATQTAPYRRDESEQCSALIGDHDYAITLTCLCHPNGYTVRRSIEQERPAATTTENFDRCTNEPLRLLYENLTPCGILAARRCAAMMPAPTPVSSAATRYLRARDGRRRHRDARTRRGASLDSLAAGQAPNGQIPKYVEADGTGADFWYVGCIDATLWWLIAVDHVRRSSADSSVRNRWQPNVERAIQWLMAQEHQRFFLLQQNEASDWADIMPRSVSCCTATRCGTA